LRHPEDVASALSREVAAALGLAPSAPWHTTRFPVTRVGDALATASSAMGRIASDVLTLARPEIAELGEPVVAGRGGSSTMPQKQNPVLAVLVRRAAITAPGLAATLHTAAAFANDERPDGAWHAEWATLRDLARRTVVAAAHASELVGGLQVDVVAMSERARAADGLLAERDAVRRLLADDIVTSQNAADDGDPSSYLGITDQIVQNRTRP
ncbi:MAG TPA: lyase family protein, partial [Nocardioides sp.]